MYLIKQYLFHEKIIFQAKKIQAKALRDMDSTAGSRRHTAVEQSAGVTSVTLKFSTLIFKNAFLKFVLLILSTDFILPPP